MFDKLRSLRALLAIAMLAMASAGHGAISQVPLFVDITEHPNVLLNMSIESPMGGAAYNDQPDSTCGGRDGGTGICYFTDTEYLGYFDPDKCYTYNSDKFVPSSTANADHSCSGAEFSGNFMNWATMTAMDMFVWTMTGGNRVVDATTETVIRRTRKHNNDSWFPPKRVDSSDNVAPSTVTPWSDDTIHITNTAFGVKFGTTAGGNEKGDYNVQIQVCDDTISLEDNCVSYDGGNYYKPEGLIQQSADRMRFAVTSYLDDNDKSRDGGVLRSNMKYVGPETYDPTNGWQANANKEYGTDGLLIDDPDNKDSEGGVDYSGVINYVNKFSDYGYKSYDPASELFYESIRYYKNLGRTPEYADGCTDAEKGGFPVLTSWDDPYQYWCQKSFIIGINDANPWLDKQLPGTHFTSDTFNGHSLTQGDDYGEPSNPDSDIDVTALTNEVGDLEGLTGTAQCIGCTADDCDMNTTDKTIPGLGEVLGTCPYPDKENSYYIAGLAYYAHTNDLRDDLEGRQDITTFMIDTQEYNAVPLTGDMNMLWLAGKYGGFSDRNDDDTPDQTPEWDNDGDGVPDNYVLATQPQKMVAGLERSFVQIHGATASSAAVVANSVTLETGTHIYQAQFNSGDWSGNLKSYPLDADGNIGSADWDAATKLDLMDADTDREIITWDPDDEAGIPFRWGDLTATQQGALNTNPVTGAADTSGEDRLEYVRGDDANEEDNDGAFRTRSTKLGDVVNSTPYYVGPYPNFNYRADFIDVDDTSTYYSDFRDTIGALNGGDGRTPVLYVGANDGMLHGFNAETGSEILAFVPNVSFSELNDLTNPDYSHQYYVDGSPTVGDAYDAFPACTGSCWRTILVSGMNAGGQAIFGLDVTQPDSFDESVSGNLVLWEIDSSMAGFADLGYTYSQPPIVRMNNGEWAAVFGNGYGSANHKAVLYIVDLATGSLIRAIDTEADGTAGSPNGLSSPATVDVDNDRKVDYIYAGDLQGHLWKFDVTDDSNTNKWEVAFKQGSTPKPLFTAESDGNDIQPITSRPEVGHHPEGGGGYVIYFGTGKYFETDDDDVGSATMQSFYGVWDRNDGTFGYTRSDLVEQTILAEVSQTFGSYTYDIRVTSDNAVAWDDDDNSTAADDFGWYMDLIDPDANNPGERVIFAPILRGGRIIFTTLIPSLEACGFGGTGWLMELDASDGSRLESTPWDLNRDSYFNEQEYANVTLDDGSTLNVPVSGKQSQVGLIQRPTIIGGGEKEYKYTSGSKNAQIELTVESTSTEGKGRTSWRQLK